MDLTVKWNKQEICVKVEDGITLGEFKRRLLEKTGAVTKLKLLGAKLPKTDNDLVPLKSLKTGKIIMLGTPVGAAQNAQEKEKELLELQDEIADDLEFEANTFAVPPHLDPIYLAKVEKRVNDYKIEVFNEPRPGKKLLVLDIDYTLFDHRSTVESARELMRPFLHEFLTSAYVDYDIIIWSATSMRWIEMKMGELGVYPNPNYKIVCFVDANAMINVDAAKYGLVRVKPLGVIWARFPDLYSPKNTIMFDDIRRNFLMNPSNGLKIRPFREARLNQGTDRELVGLTRYLKLIAKLDSFETLDHKRWEKYNAENEGD